MRVWCNIRRQEEEQRLAEELEQKRREEEELRLAEEARRVEQERYQRAVKEQERKRREEEERLEIERQEVSCIILGSHTSLKVLNFFLYMQGLEST